MMTTNRIPQVLKGKCPQCEIGDVFEKNGSIFKLQAPKMHRKCPHCGFVFEREPGYFLGAMYVSYALSIAMSVAVYFALSLFNLSFPIHLSILLAILVLTSFVNFRYSRIVWMYFFTDKAYNEINSEKEITTKA